MVRNVFGLNQSASARPGLVVLHHGVDPKVHNTQCTGEHINIHLTRNGIPEKLGCHYRGTHCLVELFSFFWGDIIDYPWTALSPRLLMISTNPGGGHEDLSSNCHSITSWGGVAGLSLLLVAAGQSPLWATNRDPLGQAWVLQLSLQLWLHWVSWWGRFCQPG